jgi:hypothetical protein
MVLNLREINNHEVLHYVIFCTYKLLFLSYDKIPTSALHFKIFLIYAEQELKFPYETTRLLFYSSILFAFLARSQRQVVQIRLLILPCPVHLSQYKNQRNDKRILIQSDIMEFCYADNF